MRYVFDLHFGRANPGIFRAVRAYRRDLTSPVSLVSAWTHNADAKAALEELNRPTKAIADRTGTAAVHRPGPGIPRWFVAATKRKPSTQAVRTMRADASWQMCCDGWGTFR